MALTDRGRDLAEKLACGRSLDEVWERVAGPPDDHEASCPYCTEARERLGRLHRATRELTEHEATDPAMEVSPNLKASILDIARTDGILVIQITLNAGRTVEMKKALFARIADRLAEQPDQRIESDLTRGKSSPRAMGPRRCPTVAASIRWTISNICAGFSTRAGRALRNMSAIAVMARNCKSSA
jgi:hypothetical protein